MALERSLVSREEDRPYSAKDSNYVQPNLYEVAIKNLRDGYNERAYIKMCIRDSHKIL